MKLLPYLASLLVAVVSSTALAGTYTTAAHGDSTSGVSGRASGYATGNCAHCHDQHASRQGTTHTPYSALRGLREENLCLDCHDGSPATDDIASQVAKTYSHPITTYSGRHTTSKLEKSTGGSAFQGANRHVECADCHNPHEAQTGNHSQGSNAVSTALAGVWGVELASEPATFTPATTFTEQSPATKEYQICFKCHTYYALQDADGITTLTGPSGQTITDQGMEFSQNNRSVHPVRYSLNNQTNSDALDATQLADPWDNNPGTQTMYCSDCHGADDENGGGAVGPHGSTSKYMLKGYLKDTAVYWPASSAGKLWSLNDISQREKASGSAPTINTTTAVQSELFCLNCHNSFGGTATNPFNTSIDKTTWANNVHQKHDGRRYNPDGGDDHNVYCIACHSAIPHGVRRSSLIVYDGRDTKYGSDVEPYVYKAGGVNYAALSGFKKTAHLSYTKDNCWSTVSGCSGDHPDAGGYEGN